MPSLFSAQETLDHLFIDCPFTQEVWMQAMHGLNAQTPSQLTVVNLFTSWKGRFPHALKRKSMWAKIWYAIPKFICWEVWLARNEATFKNILRTPTVVAAKAKALLLETLENRPHKPDNALLPEEISWLGESLRMLATKRTPLGLAPIQSGGFRPLNWIFKSGGRIKAKSRFSLMELPKETQGYQDPTHKNFLLRKVTFISSQKTYF
jgi:hypothetical protein